MITQMLAAIREERAREEAAADAVAKITPRIPPADYARIAYRLTKAEHRADRAEQDRDRLLQVISMLEGHRDADLARLRHLGE